jgi:3-oxoacyl-[acyl-carrier-protein] synthase II
MADNSFQKRRVVITGMGIITPCGQTLNNFWKSVQKGKSGINWLKHLDQYNLPSRMGGYVNKFDPEKYLPARNLPRGRSCQFACAASCDAINDANICTKNINPYRFGVMIGTSVSGLGYYEEALNSFRIKGYMNPYTCISIFAGATSSEVAIRFHAKGPSFTFSNGCTAGTDAIGNAFHAIRNGSCDVILCGGSEAPVTPAMMSGFCSLHVLSTRKCAPSKASCPFDESRDGMVLSEGAAMLVLENFQHAINREAKIYGEIIGYAATCDAHHMVRPAENVESAYQSMVQAIHDAGLQTSDIQAINAHGTSTQLNDITETLAIKKLFGKHTEHIPVYAVKSITGHAIGASGAIEVVAGVLGLHHNILPPLVNLKKPDKNCDLNFVLKKQRADINVLIKNSFGFGGKNACLIIRKM